MIFSGTSILRYELGVMGRASTDSGVYAPNVVRVAKSGPKPKQNEIELRSFHHSIRLDELIILVWSNVQIGYKMTELWPSQDWPKVAAQLFLDHFWPF